MSSFSQEIRFDADHPALPGHFPDQPLVPGVLMLEQVALALRAWRDQRLARVLEAKFVASLLPDQSAQLQLIKTEGNDLRIRFRIQRGDTVLARGIVESAR